MALSAYWFAITTRDGGTPDGLMVPSPDGRFIGPCRLCEECKHLAPLSPEWQAELAQGMADWDAQLSRQSAQENKWLTAEVERLHAGITQAAVDLAASSEPGQLDAPPRLRALRAGEEGPNRYP